MKTSFSVTIMDPIRLKKIAGAKALDICATLMGLPDLPSMVYLFCGTYVSLRVSVV